jgi:integrase/recombinase XerD
LNFNNIESEHYDAWPLGHSKLETTARYTQVATNIIRKVMSPLDRLTPLRPKDDKPE